MLEIVGNTVLKLEYSCEFVTLVNKKKEKKKAWIIRIKLYNID